jgi:hypothetical protein
VDKRSDSGAEFTLYCLASFVQVGFTIMRSCVDEEYIDTRIILEALAALRFVHRAFLSVGLRNGTGSGSVASRASGLLFSYLLADGEAAVVCSHQSYGIRVRPDAGYVRKIVLRDDLRPWRHQLMICSVDRPWLRSYLT